MKAMHALFLTAGLAVCVTIVSAKDSNESDGGTDVQMKTGIESRKIAPGLTVVMPMGVQMRQVNENLSVMESAEEYAGRKVVDIEARMVRLEKENADFKKQFESIGMRLDEFAKQKTQAKQ